MEVLAHTLVVIVFVVGYVIVSVTGNDGNALLAALGAYGGGVGITKLAQGKTA